MVCMPSLSKSTIVKAIKIKWLKKEIKNNSLFVWVDYLHFSNRYRNKQSQTPLQKRLELSWIPLFVKTEQ